MKQITLISFEDIVDFFRYIEPNTSFTYIECDKDKVVIEMKEEDWKKAYEEYQADTYTGYEYI